MEQSIQWIRIFAIGLLVTTVSATSIIDFLKLGGINYVNRGPIGRELRDEDLGAEITKVKFKFVWDGDRPGTQPSYGPEEAYAASLDIGTSVYALKGYATTFRLAARTSGKIVLFEADNNPKARKGSDLFDLSQVAYIGVNNEQDGVTELAAIKDPTLVANLVRGVLNAPIQNSADHSGLRYFIAFHFRDGTATSRAYWINSGELSRGIMLPPEFATTVKEALKRAEGAR